MGAPDLVRMVKNEVIDLDEIIDMDDYDVPELLMVKPESPDGTDNEDLDAEIPVQPIAHRVKGEYMDAPMLEEELPAPEHDPHQHADGVLNDDQMNAMDQDLENGEEEGEGASDNEAEAEEEVEGARMQLDDCVPFALPVDEHPRSEYVNRTLIAIQCFFDSVGYRQTIQLCRVMKFKVKKPACVSQRHLPNITVIETSASSFPLCKLHLSMVALPC